MTLRQAARRAQRVLVASYVRTNVEDEPALFGYVEVTKRELRHQLTRGFLKGAEPAFDLNSNDDLYVG